MEDVSLVLRQDGGAEGVRTPDLLNAIQALYQLSYDPIQSEKFYRDAAGSQKQTWHAKASISTLPTSAPGAGGFQAGRPETVSHPFTSRS